MKRKHKHQHAGGEVTELARETAQVEQYWIVGDRPEPRKPPKNYNYIEELINLQIELQRGSCGRADASGATTQFRCAAPAHSFGPA